MPSGLTTAWRLPPGVGGFCGAAASVFDSHLRSPVVLENKYEAPVLGSRARSQPAGGGGLFVAAAAAAAAVLGCLCEAYGGGGC